MGNHFGFRATAAFGDWMVGLESEELYIGLCVFIEMFPCSNPCFLKGNSSLRCRNAIIQRQFVMHVPGGIL